MSRDINPIRQKISREGAQGALEQRSPGFIATVTQYHPQADSCDCEIHVGKEYKPHQRHTANIVVYVGKEAIKYPEVPCFVYAHGLFDYGLEKGDRVWVEFINGDPQHPIITAYYRDPKSVVEIWERIKDQWPKFFNFL